MDLPVTGTAAPLALHLVYTDDGLYLPAIASRPPGRGPFPVIIAIHGSSGGLGVPYLVDEVTNRGWALEVMLAHGYAVVFAEGRMEHEDAYGTGIPFPLDHNDMVAMLSYVARQPWADVGRIGFFGVSHGGEMQMKLAAEIAANGGAPMPAALAMCEPAVIEFLGLKYQGVRKEANLQFQAPIADSTIDIAPASARIACIPDTLPMLVVGREEDHLQGLFMKLHELLKRAGKQAEWASFSHPDHAYQFGPRRTAEGYRPDSVQISTLERVMAFLDQNVRDKR
jgi:acetyl esterase/lipase